MRIIFGVVIVGLVLVSGFFLLSKKVDFDERKIVNIYDQENNLITVFQVEIADTPLKRARGLMFRESLDEDKGMFFIFPEEKEHSFWMKNTYIPLDLIFINQNHEIVGIIENAQPESDQQLTIGRPSKYVLEVNAGMVEKWRIEEGQQIKLEII